MLNAELSLLPMTCQNAVEPLGKRFGQLTSAHCQAGLLTGPGSWACHCRRAPTCCAGCEALGEIERVCVCVCVCVCDHTATHRTVFQPARLDVAVVLDAQRRQVDRVRRQPSRVE